MRSPYLKLGHLPRIFIEGGNAKNQVISTCELGNEMRSTV